MARAGEEECEEHDALRRQKPPPPQAFFRLYDEEDAEWGARPGSVTDPRPQQRVLRHIVEHLEDPAPMVQILDVPVPQKGNELADIFKLVDK